MAKYKTIIGRAELLDFPARAIIGVPAKTDTGAYLSAVHATDIEEFTNNKGQTRLRFNLLNGHPSSPGNSKIEVTKFTKRTVENSFGQRQERYVVSLQVKIANRTFRTDFSLADRSKKSFPILLGRTMINKRFVVDTDIAHIDQKKLKIDLKEWLLKDDLEDSEEEQK